MHARSGAFRFLCMGLWLALLPIGGHAASALVAVPQDVARVTAVEGITEYRLPNGLRVLLAPDETKPSATVNVTYLVGSRYERYGETGMAHLLEHLMFKGSRAFPGNTIDAEFKRRGMQMNGTTWFDRTNYYETFAASDDNLDWALRMEADRMVNAFIAKADLDSEMTVVRNEMEAGENDPGQILAEKMAAAAYQWHNYGKSTIGARSDVEGVQIENLQAFYRRYYQPDNAVLVVAGRFDETDTLARIVRYFGAIPHPVRALTPTWTREPVQDGERVVNLSRVGDEQIVGALYHLPEGAHPDTAALSVLANILTDVPGGRLHRALVERGLAASVDGTNFELAEPGYLSVFAHLTKRHKLTAAQDALLRTVEGFARQPVTAAELKRARTALLNGFETVLNDPAHFGVALSEAIALGDWRLFFLSRDRIERVTEGDVQRVATRYFKPSNRTVGRFVPTDKPDRVAPPASPPLAAMLEGYVGKSAQEAGEVFDPSPANIELRVRRSVLDNGMQIALLPKRTRGGTVHGQIVLRMGDERSLFGRTTVASFVAEMLERGAGGQSRQAIADRLDALKATLSVGAEKGGTVLVTFETRRDTLQGFLALLADVLRRPDFPARELEQLRTEMLAGIEASRREPQAMASRALGRQDNPWPRGDVRYVATVDEAIADVKAVKRSQLLAFHRDFYGASHTQLALVGDFDEAAVRAQLADVFGQWRSMRPYARVADPYRATKPADIKLDAPDKANAFFIGGLAVPVRDDAAEQIPLVLANQILGGGTGLKSRLADRIRQAEGISYGVGSVYHGNPHEPNASWILYAIYAPQNLARLRTALDDELTRLVRDGVTEDELAEARAGLLQQRQLGRSDDGALAGLLSADLDLGRTMEFESSRDNEIKTVSVDRVNEVIRKYLVPERILRIHAGAFMLKNQ